MNKKIINVLTIFVVVIVTLFVLPKYSNAEYKYITGQDGKKIILGDVTGDGTIDNKDYYTMIKHLIAKINGNNSNILTGNKFLAGDIVKDKYNDILANDIVAMRKYLIAKNNSSLANKEWLKILEKEETSKKQVTQTSKTNSKINPTGISITKTAKIKIGETKKLIATVTPTNATNKTVYWESVKSNIVQVDSFGNVKGIKVGKTTIKAKTVNGKIAICIVEVVGTTTNNNNKATTTTNNNNNKATTTNNNNNNKVAETTLTLEKNNITIYQNETIPIKANIKNGKSGDSVQWTSRDESIAKVDSIGRVTAIKPGNVTIVAKTTKSNKMAECKIYIPQTTLRINKTKITLDKGTSLTLSATVINKATEDKINWKSDNEKVAKVSNGKVTAIGAGTAKIIAITSKTRKVAVTTVTVKVPESKITLNKNEIVLSGVGKTTKLIATIEPKDSNNKTITWTSSNQNIATVDKNGIILAKAPGSCKITAKTSNGKTASCTVNVQFRGINMLNGDKVYFLDVDNADCMLLYSEGKYGMIDTGRKTTVDRVKTYLKDLGIKELEFILITHFDADHYGGYYEIGKYLKDNGGKVKETYIKEVSQSNIDENIKKLANSLKTTVKIVGAKCKTIEMGNFSFNLYNLTDNSLKSNGGFEWQNINSIVAVATVKSKTNRKIAFMGDLTDSKGFSQNVISTASKICKNVAKQIGKVDVYKAAHHAYNGNNEMKTYSPKYSIIPNHDEKLRKEKYESTINKIKNGTINEKTKKKVYANGNGTVIMNINSSGTLAFKQLTDNT